MTMIGQLILFTGVVGSIDSLSGANSNLSSQQSSGPTIRCNFRRPFVDQRGKRFPTSLQRPVRALHSS